MFYGIPTWFKVWCVVAFIVGVAAATFAFQKCGLKALLLGNGAVSAAMMGMCDE